MGNAVHSATASALRAVHPHAHGERDGLGHRAAFSDGSSPRTWGTLAHLLGVVAVPRFIPTHMGNATWPPSRPPARSVHPHAHGERLETVRPVSAATGSSPRTWGTRIVVSTLQPLHRFIPTHMGNASVSRLRPVRKPVHPHAHGERHARTTHAGPDDGSSPRTWGTP